MATKRTTTKKSQAAAKEKDTKLKTAPAADKSKPKVAKKTGSATRKVAAKVAGKKTPAAKPVTKTKLVAQTKPAAKAKPVTKTKPAALTKPAAKAKPVTKTKPAAQTKPAAKAKPVTKTKLVAQTKPAAKTKPAARTKPVTVREARIPPSEKKVAASRKATPQPPSKGTTKGKTTKKASEAKPVAAVRAKTTSKQFSKSDLKQFHDELWAIRERMMGQAGAMRSDALQRDDKGNIEEDGTDAFLRLQTLTQVGSHQQNIMKIDEALRSIDKGDYGICDMCGELINKSRLKVLPFARNCINCQSELEKTSQKPKWR